VQDFGQRGADFIAEDAKALHKIFLQLGAAF
jgi:hypothetical protein